MECSRCAFEMVLPALADQHPLFDQRLDDFFHEKWIPLSLLQDAPLERLDVHAYAQQCREQLFGLLMSQGVESQLCVIGLAPPAMLVLWSVIHQEQKTRRGQALTQ